MVPERATSELDLRARWLTLRRRKGIVALAVLLILGVSIAYSYSQPARFASSAKVLLRPQSVSQVFASDASQRAPDQGQSVETEMAVITTEPVEELVRQKVSRPASVKISQVGQTDLITIRAESPDPKLASATANAYANAYIDYKRKQTIDELFAGSEEVQTKIADLQKQIDDLSAQLDAAPVCVDVKTTTVACAQRTNIEQTVGLRRTTLLNQQALFRSRLDELQVDQALTTGGAQLVTPASTPTVPFEPRHRRTAILGAMIGLVFGIGLAFLIDHLDDSIKSKDDLEHAASGLAVLGLIPAVPDWKAREKTRLVSISNPTSPGAEAYRTLRTSIQFLGLDRNVRLIQVTSASAEEGKSTTLSNLAVAFANSGLRTVAVDCDLRRPRLHAFFGLSNEVGFTSVLLGNAPLSKALRPVPGQERLLVLASGPLPPNPSELLSSVRTGDLLRNLASQADVVLIDSPPVLPVTDALVLSQRVDATLLISAVRTTTGKAAARTIEMLRQVHAPLVGAVLNGVTDDGGYGYSGYGSRYYSEVSTSGNGTDNGNGHRSRIRRRARAKQLSET